MELITLVVHTCERAAKLKEVLESHGITVVLEDVSLPGVALPVKVSKVRIPVDSLALGLKIIESGESLATPLSAMRLAGGVASTLLIPVDFSQGSLTAVAVGFWLAQRFDVRPVLFHAYDSPMFNPAEPFAQVPEESLMVEEEAETDLYKMADARLKAFAAKIRDAQKEGSMRDVEFDTVVAQGLPEHAIHTWCRDHNPLLVVMATRGTHKRASDLVGSVTAEVIDSCRVPVLAVPDTVQSDALRSIGRVGVFCTFTPYDIVTTRGMMRAMDYPTCTVDLIPAAERSVPDAEKRLRDLCGYFNSLYPTAEFVWDTLGKGKFDDEVRDIIKRRELSMIIVPNKKSSAFTRFFRPTLAHKILFDNDLPLLVLPV